jgi:hypothetical protein
MLCFFVAFTIPTLRALDDNADGASDVWAVKYGLLPGDLTTDRDGDGANGLSESFAGTDPGRSMSRLQCDITGDAGGVTLTWWGVQGIRYHVQNSSNLLSWDALSGVIEGTNGPCYAIDGDGGSSMMMFSAGGGSEAAPEELAAPGEEVPLQLKPARPVLEPWPALRLVCVVAFDDGTCLIDFRIPTESGMQWHRVWSNLPLGRLSGFTQWFERGQPYGAALLIFRGYDKERYSRFNASLQSAAAELDAADSSPAYVDAAPEIGGWCSPLSKAGTAYLTWFYQYYADHADSLPTRQETLARLSENLTLNASASTGTARQFYRVVTVPTLDQDGDGLNAFEEGLLGTSDSSLDSDGDGAEDLAEFVIGTNPNLADMGGDLDGDGVPNGQDAAPNSAAVGATSFTIDAPAAGSEVP